MTAPNSHSSRDDNELDDLHDKIITEQDKRRIQKLIDDGTIDPEQLSNAPIYELVQQCDCTDTEPDDFNRCVKCLTKYEEKEVEL